ncbi:MAG: ABC transporter ATP-binding protein [Ramlibacter sp.]|nr:ABC transporter ATP-binding protein [Ramlibacter sp.]
MIRIENLCKKYDGREGLVTAVADVSFEVEEGQICVLLGPSGCGKTTTLKMINRLIEPTSGKVHIDGRDTTGMDTVTLRRSIGYVIQVGLFPNMTVEDNICVVPDLLGWPRDKSRKRAGELLEIVALDPEQFLKRFPKELSGGQQQRVGVARALAADPPVMLMDEPFGAIDPINREIIQDEFMRIQRHVRKTVLFVSHDIDEAVKMADKVAVFRAGRIEQFGSPDDLLARPANKFVAEFMGSDRALKRLRLMRAGGIARRSLNGGGDGIKVDTDADGRIVGQVPLCVGAADDLRQVLSAQFARGTSWAACVDTDGRFAGYVMQADILANLVEATEVRGGV